MARTGTLVGPRAAEALACGRFASWHRHQDETSRPPARPLPVVRRANAGAGPP